MSNDIEVQVGRIGRAHGLRGEVGVRPSTDFVDRRFAPGATLRSEAGRVEADPDARHDIYRRVETLLAEKALLVPFCHRQSYCFVQPEIRGVRMRLSPSSLAFDRLRLAD